MSGCSFFLVDGRPSPPLDQNRHVECTTSQAAPAVDVALGALSAGFGTVTLATLPKSPCSDFSCIGADAIKGVGIGALVVGAIYLASGTYGFIKTNACKNALAAQRACADGDKEMCDRLTPTANVRSPR